MEKKQSNVYYVVIVTVLWMHLIEKIRFTRDVIFFIAKKIKK